MNNLLRYAIGGGIIYLLFFRKDAQAAAQPSSLAPADDCPTCGGSGAVRESYGANLDSSGGSTFTCKDCAGTGADLSNDLVLTPLPQDTAPATGTTPKQLLPKDPVSESESSSAASTADSQAFNPNLNRSGTYAPLSPTIDVCGLVDAAAAGQLQARTKLAEYLATRTVTQGQVDACNQRRARGVDTRGQLVPMPNAPTVTPRGTVRRMPTFLPIVGSQTGVGPGLIDTAKGTVVLPKAGPKPRPFGR